MSDPHGVDRVDTITALIDEALSGYETQRAGDYWYSADADADDLLSMVGYRWTGEQFVVDPDGPLVTSLTEAVGRAWSAVVDVIRPVYDQLAELAEAWNAAFPATKDTDPLRLSNNWVDRACWAWDWDMVSDDCRCRWAGWGDEEDN